MQKDSLVISLQRVDMHDEYCGGARTLERA